MSASDHYKELKSELARLRRELLPKRFTLSGNYSPEIVTKTIAYCVLAHAEIESYLEDRARETALAAIEAWNRRKKVSKTLLALLAFSGRTMEEPPHSVYPDQPSQSSIWDDKIRLSNKIELAMNDFNHAVMYNHGIKEDNLLRLLLPIGIEVDKLDHLLLADLNSFGGQRGELAHKSQSKYRAKQQIDPKSELAKVLSLLARLVDVDRAVTLLSRELT